MKKILISLIALFLAAFFIAGCAAPVKLPDPPSDIQGELIYLVYSDESGPPEYAVFVEGLALPLRMPASSLRIVFGERISKPKVEILGMTAWQSSPISAIVIFRDADQLKEYLKGE